MFAITILEQLKTICYKPNRFIIWNAYSHTFIMMLKLITIMENINKIFYFNYVR